MRRLLLAAVVLASLATACTSPWHPPSGGILPPPTPTAMPNCDMPVPSGWIFVQFPNDLSPEHAEEIIEHEEGAFVVHVEQMMNPIAFPIPAPDIEGYWLVVGVPEGKEDLFVTIFRAHPDVLSGARRLARLPALHGVEPTPSAAGTASAGATAALDVAQHLVGHVAAHLAQVVVAFLVHRQRERRDALVLRLHQRLVRVVDGVLLLRAVAAVAVVLRPAVGDQEEDLRLRVALRPASNVVWRIAGPMRVERIGATLSMRVGSPSPNGSSRSLIT